MKININKDEYNKCLELLNAKESSISAADFYIEYLTEKYNGVESAKNESDFYSRLLDVMDCDKNDPEIEEINKYCHIDKINVLNPDEYQKDSFYQTFKDVKSTKGDVNLMILKCKPFEGFVWNELEIDKNNYAEHTPIGYFEKEFPYLAVVKNDTVWMSVIPHEIETMREPIKNAHGNVLVLGLGLGYYLFHILSKKEVISVDVVEFDKEIIDLFNNNIIDKFPHKEKINIIYDDAFKYLNKIDKHYDYVFADIWHNVGDGEKLYLKLKPFENKFKTTTFDYWIETSILAMLRRQTLTVFSEYFEGFKETDYKIAKNENDEIINRVYFYHEDTVIDSFEDLHKILSDNELKLMAKNLFK